MLVLILNDERGYIIYINGNHYPDILIKVSQREYLEDIKNGKIYFNYAEYFRKFETDKSKDSRESKVAIDTSYPVDLNDEVLNLLHLLNPEELNMSYISSAKTPIFCCSLLESHMLVPTGENTYDLSYEYLQEMSCWGSSVLVFSLDEFCRKIYQKCNSMGIIPLIDKVEYDQDNKKLSFSDFKKMMITNKFEPFFHKTKRFINQNEFRVVLGGDKIVTSSDHYILEIGRLESAQIFDLNSLGDLGFRVIKNSRK